MSSPWMTRREAADWLRTSVQTVDRKLIEWQARPVRKKLRFVRLDWNEDGSPAIRVLAEDVHRFLPDPESDAPADSELEPASQPKTIPGTFHR